MFESVAVLVCAGDDIRKMEETYNQAQRQWMDDMINACQVSHSNRVHRNERLR